MFYADKNRDIGERNNDFRSTSNAFYEQTTKPDLCVADLRMNKYYRAD